MKTTPLDYWLSSLTLAILVGGALGLTTLLHPMTQDGLGPYHVLADAALFLLSFGILSAVASHLMLRFKPLRPGRFPMDHPQFTYWKLLTVVREFGTGALLPFTTVFHRPIIAKAFGARIGREIALGGTLVDHPLIAIGDFAIIGQDSVTTAHAITSGHLVLDPVEIGSGATIGVNAAIMCGVRVGDNAVVAANAVVTPGTRIGQGEFWGGVPARKLKDVNDAESKGNVNGDSPLPVGTD